MSQPVCVVSVRSVPAAGSALARWFAAGGQRVAMLAAQRGAPRRARTRAARHQSLSMRRIRAAQVEAVADPIERELGAPAVLIHNAVGGAFGSFLEIDPASVNRNFQVSTMGLLFLARRFAPAMVRAGSGSIIVTGNTSVLRGKAAFVGFRTDQGCATHPGGIDGARARAVRDSMRVDGGRS